MRKSVWLSSRDSKISEKLRKRENGKHGVFAKKFKTGRQGILKTNPLCFQYDKRIMTGNSGLKLDVIFWGCRGDRTETVVQTFDEKQRGRLRNFLFFRHQQTSKETTQKESFENLPAGALSWLNWGTVTAITSFGVGLNHLFIPHFQR